MKILQINKFLYPVGGAETYMFNLGESLKEGGVAVDYWGMQSEENIIPDTDHCFAPNIDYKNLNYRTKVTGSLRTLYSFKNRSLIRKKLEAFGPDIVHLHNYNFQLTPSILPEIKKRNGKIIYTAHDSQLVCPWHRMYNFQYKRTCSKCITGSFFNCVRDRCFNDSRMQSIIGATESVLYHNLNYYKKYIDLIISPSQFLADLIRKRVDCEIKVLPNFTDINPGVIASARNRCIVYFGRISEEKGIVRLVDIFEKNKIHIKIIGSGDDLRLDENYEYVEFLGPKYGEELYAIVGESLGVIIPSVWFENCPMSLIESFAMGTPVIGANHSGLKEFIMHGKTGFLINFEEPDFEDKLIESIKGLNPEMNIECRKEYERRFNKDKHLKEIISIYQELMQ